MRSQIGVLRRPAEFAAHLLRVGDQLGRIAAAAAGLPSPAIGLPVTASTAPITSRTLYPRPMPTL